MRTWAILLALLSSAASAEVDLHSMVKEHRLANGMKWLVVERHQAPVFTAYVRVRVGGADEEPGRTGLAHLFEHMAFKGTPVLGTKDFEQEKKLLAAIADAGDRLSALEREGKGESEEAAQLRRRVEELQQKHDAITDENALERIYLVNGADELNATTDKDLTSYFVSLPKNRLELWAVLEASRLASPVLRDFYTERDVVLEERRSSIDADPTGALLEELDQLAFTMSPYRWPTVGYADDLRAATLRDATEFHRRHYVPSNAVGCIVGDVKLEEVVPLLERTFGAIPARPAPPRPLFAEPPPRFARRSTVVFDASPLLAMGFRKPAPPARDDYVFDVIQVLLGEGRTGRLHRRLVLEDRLAQSVAVFGSPGSRLENLFVVYVVPMSDVSLDAIEAAVWEELERLKTQPVPPAELEKVRNRISADHARALGSNDGLASVLSEIDAIVGDWRYAADHPKVIAGITADDVQRVARHYFRRERSAVVRLAREVR